MPDENTNTPGQQAPAPGQQASEDPTTDWKSRFKGLQKKFNVLMEAKGELDSQLVDLRSKTEEKDKQLATLSNEKDSLLVSHQKKIDDLNGKLGETAKSLSELAQVQLKVQVANEMGHPELLQLIDTIPNSEDPEKIKGAFQTVLGFAQKQIEQREQQLSEGLMPGESTGAETPVPTTDQGWNELIESLPLGSDERNKAFDQYFTWTQGGR